MEVLRKNAATGVAKYFCLIPEAGNFYRKSNIFSKDAAFRKES